MIKILSFFKKSDFAEYALAFLLFCFIGTLAFGKGYAYAITDGIKLWAACVLPALFPYFFATTVLSSLSVTGKFAKKLSPLTEKLFNASGLMGYAFSLSATSGYPVGAKTVADLKKSGLISETEAVRASTFCSSPSPMFLIASVGSITFNDRKFGVCLFISNLLAAVTTGIFFSFYKRKDAPTRETLTFKRADNVLYNGVYSAVISILVVGGLIALFSVITAILTDFNALKPITAFIGLFTDDESVKNGIAAGLLECTGGLKILSSAKNAVKVLPVAAALSGFGGCCVLAQSAAYLKTAKIKLAPFFLAKTAHAILSFLFGFITSLLFFG